MTPTTTPDNPNTSNSRELKSPDDEYGWVNSVILQYQAEKNQGLNELAGRGTPEEQLKQQIISSIQQNYTPNSEVERVKQEAQLESLKKAKNYFDGFNLNVVNWLNDDMAVITEQLSNKEDK